MRLDQGWLFEGQGREAVTRTPRAETQIPEMEQGVRGEGRKVGGRWVPTRALNVGQGKSFFFSFFFPGAARARSARPVLQQGWLRG